MSGIQLSNELVADVKAVIEKHDSEASDDLLFLQYLSAVSGYVLAHNTKAGMDKKSFIDDLATFTTQVFEQVSEEAAPQRPQEEAFGVWKPGQS